MWTHPSSRRGQPDLIQINVETGDITCAGGRDGELIILASGGTSPFTYSLDGKSFTANPRFIGRKAGSYTLYVKDSNGCQKSMTTELIDPPAFSVSIFPTTDVLEINFGESVQLFANTNNQIGKVTYSWSASFADSTLSCFDCFNPMVMPTTTTYYELLGTDEAGCKATDDIQIRVRKTRTVLVPTGFTPNGDAVNNNLIVHGSSSTNVKLFRVYDRYGELIFENEQLIINDPMTGWDGTFRGKEMPAGVYVWYAEVEYEDGMKEALKGSTLLIR
ncbi:MAG: T9SS type B sorting domain-containing protein [Saprospiraceae bacterium]|nr:T9SS type B sorting domain-containing protein [Saprospiraceae bacterium]